MQNKQRLLHIYGQSFWHEPAFIVGNIQGLRALQKAIEQAIDEAVDVKNPGTASAECFTNDGEGYIVFVVCDEGNFEKRALPYTDEAAREKSPDTHWPWQDIEEGLKGK